jgi:DNA-binding response OmpR family regulator
LQKKKKKKLIKTNYNIVFFRSYINNILIIKRFEMNELRAKIKSLAERNRLATTDEERATVAAEMNTLRSENEQAFTEALEALIKTTADAVQELHGRHIKNN